MDTIFEPPCKAAHRMAWQPVVWKNGTDTSAARCSTRSSGLGTGSPLRTKLRWAEMLPAQMVVTEQRCVPSAPFCAPVVPEV